MEDELILADLGVAERRLERLEKDLKKTRTADLERERDVLTICRPALEEGRPLRALDLQGEDLKRLRGFQFLSAKPLLIVINLDESQLAGEAATRIDRAAEATGLTPFLSRAARRRSRCAPRSSWKSRSSTPADARRFLADLGLTESGLDRVIRASYDLLGYISFFTVGEDECRAWSIPRGTPAQLAAGEIHSDIARGFIRAEVVSYDALDRARLDGRLPRSRRGAPRRQGVHRPGRRHHQLPLRHMTLSRRTSVVVPAFNEEHAVGAIVAGLRGAAEWREILVVDDGSSDGTADQAALAGARVVRHPYNKGNGAAVKTGIRQARATSS